MKIDVKDSPDRSGLKLCEFPFEAELIGEEEDDEQLKIFIQHGTLGDIDKYLSSDLHNELGGVLVGDVCTNNDGKNFIVIDNFIIAKHTNSSLSRLTFTHETWNYINEILENDYTGKKILGWFHSHPGHTVFLSTFDVFIQENFFNLEYMVAYVFDPTIKERGFFLWKENKIVRANGFYVYRISDKDILNELTVNRNVQDSNTKTHKDKDSKSGKDTMKSDSRSILILSLLLLTLLLVILTMYNLYDLKQKALLKEEYVRDISELKDYTKNLNERLDSFIKENESIDKNLNSNSDNFDSGKTLAKYTVKSGDTVDKIADEFYKNKEAAKLIMQKNNLKSKWDIKIGQVLELPAVNE
jgi:LysM repeat protein/proteasome lid subunit RPN8/RPN11